jgi:chemotaxis protein MotB
VKSLPNKIEISGHTDAKPYPGGHNYTNWELSADRANASRRVLVGAGIAADRLEKIEGRADTDPFVKADPFDPQNRRISIVLLREPKPAQPAGSTTTPASAPTPAPTDAPATATPPTDAPASTDAPAAKAEPPAELVP